MDDQVTDHCAERFLDGRQRHADDLFGDLLADLLEQPLHDHASGLSGSQRTDLGEPEGERSRGLRALLPSILASAVLVFALVFDDFVLAYFTTGVD
ncbi:hypothetical protein ACWCPC_38985, partial [Streptomyces decoyicus]